MTTFVETFVGSLVTAQYIGAGTNYLVETSAGVLYQVYVDGNSDVVFSKSSDSGKTWTDPVTVFTGTTTQLSVWFGPWSGIANGLIYCAYTESVTDDVLYRTIDTASADALGTQTTIFAGVSAGVNGCISITASRGGNLICAGCIDAGLEPFSKKSTDGGASWGNIASPYEATTDQLILAPGFAADNQDILCIYWDADVEEISRKVYDDSGDSWAETSIATSMVDSVANTGGFPNFSIAVDLTGTRLILAAWSAVDTVDADLRCWFVSESAITETTTNVVLNSVDDQGLCAVSLDTISGDIYVYYGGKSDGSEVYNAIAVYYKVTTDDGGTWGAETRLSVGVISGTRQILTNPRMVYLSAELIAISSSGILRCASIMPTLPGVATVQTGVQYGINGVQFTGTFSGGGTNSNANILGGSVVH